MVIPQAPRSHCITMRRRTIVQASKTAVVKMGASSSKDSGSRILPGSRKKIPIEQPMIPMMHMSKDGRGQKCVHNIETKGSQPKVVHVSARYTVLPQGFPREWKLPPVLSHTPAELR